MLAFKETLQDARAYFDEAAEGSKKSLVADDPMQTRLHRSTLNFPIEETDRKAAKSSQRAANRKLLVTSQRCFE